MHKIIRFALGWLVVLLPLTSSGAECTIRQSGNKCTASCSVGTLSLTCGERACSASCSDSSGNKTTYLANIYRDILIASGGDMRQSDISEMLKELRRSRFQMYSQEVRARTQTFSIAGLDAEVLNGFSEQVFDQVLRELERQNVRDLLDPSRFRRSLELLPRN